MAHPFGLCCPGNILAKIYHVPDTVMLGLVHIVEREPPYFHRAILGHPFGQVVFPFEHTIGASGQYFHLAPFTGQAFRQQRRMVLRAARRVFFVPWDNNAEPRPGGNSGRRRAFEHGNFQPEIIFGTRVEKQGPVEKRFLESLQPRRHQRRPAPGAPPDQRPYGRVIFRNNDKRSGGNRSRRGFSDKLHVQPFKPRMTPELIGCIDTCHAPALNRNIR